jgi:hypothetical protein
MQADTTGCCNSRWPLQQQTATVTGLLLGRL